MQNTKLLNYLTTFRKNHVKKIFMRPSKYSIIAHRNRTLCSPVSEQMIAQASAHLARSLTERNMGAPILRAREVKRDAKCTTRELKRDAKCTTRELASDTKPVPTFVDIGAGKCEVIAQFIEHLGGSGIALDLPGGLCEEISPRARNLLNQGRLKIELGDAGNFFEQSKTHFDLAICIGSSQALGGFAKAAPQFKQIAAHLLFGELFWKSKPSDELLDFLDMPKDSLPALSQIEIPGFTELSSQISPDEVFEEYEASLRSSIREYCNIAPSDPDVPILKSRSDAWWNARERWARDAFGFALKVFRRN